MTTNSYQTRDESQLNIAISEDELSVAPGNAIDIQVTITNESTYIEDVDLQVRGLPGTWVTSELPVIHLTGGQARQVVISLRPPPIPESRVGQYPLEIHAISQNDSNHSAVASAVLTVAVYESRGRIGALLGSIHYSVIPGSTVHIPILLQNRGLQEDSFRLDVAGIPSNWISTNSPLTSLEPSESKEVMVTVHVPRSPQAAVGRMSFAIQFTSMAFPDQRADVGCILTIAAFSQYSATLEPATLGSGQFGQVIISNEGNFLDTYTMNFQSPGNGLIFEKAVQPSTQRAEVAYVEVPPGDRIQVAPGERSVYPFRTRLRSRPYFGGEQAYPFTVNVASSETRVYELPAQLNESGFIPVWLLPALGFGSLVICLLMLFSFRNLPTSARATQTASYNQTQAALAGGVDTDGDGLIDTEETTLGTDPLVADSDGDELLDGEEVKTYQTNPLLTDTDADGLADGEEVQDHETDPRNPDTDADLLNDGDEIERDTNPKLADSDQDGLGDGIEVNTGTDPRQQDTDRDGLLDAQENQTCPRPITPDSDADGIIDGNDRDPCNAANPALTASAVAGAPTQAQPTQALPTQALPTQAPPTVAIPTLTFAPPPTSTSIPPTSPPFATLTSAPPTLQGVMVFSTNRDGNAEIYALNLGNQALTRITSTTAQDVQPALAPDSVQVAYASNQDGDNEIYLGGIDRRFPLNLTNNAADDQQPAWSPDGNWVAFTTNRDGNQEIYVVRSDGSQIRNLTNNPGNDFAATWYSVGGFFGTEDWIAFTSTRDGNQEIYKVRPDGTGLTNITNNPANDHSPSGFPNAPVLAFVSERDGNPEIYTMNPNGGAATNITISPAQDLEPSLGQNGSWIAFATDREGNLEIYVIRVQGGTAYNLTRNPGQDRDPDW